MGGVVSAGVDNDELVDKLKGADYIKSSIVEKVFRLVDRGSYLTKENQNVAYSDNAWRSGNLHISAPCIYAQVLEGLKIEPGMSFLNLGSGTGYLSTMAGLLLGPGGVNHGVEIYGDVVDYAKERLSCFYLNSGAIDVSTFCEPQFIQGNALCLSEEIMVYDRVYCGAQCPASHENYMKNLLKADLSARDIERVKFAFSIYDFDGNDTMDGAFVGDLLRALNLNPTLAVIEKMGGAKKKGEKKIKLDEFLPIFAQVKKDKDAGSYEDFIEVLKLYDKQEDGTMMFGELEHILMALGETLEKDELSPVLAACCDPEDEDGFFPYEPFLKKLCEGLH